MDRQQLLQATPTSGTSVQVDLKGFWERHFEEDLPFLLTGRVTLYLL